LSKGHFWSWSLVHIARERTVLRQAQHERIWLGGLIIALVAACAPSKLAYGQVKSAMMDAGLSEANSACMAERMTDRLTLSQLNKLKQLKGEKRGLMDYVAAVRRVGDTEAIEVTATSAALCASGLAREKRY
jgi:hypothetical protein